MKIKKIKGTFNDYQVEMSFGQITAIKNALGADHADPLSDELFAELSWYLDNIPGPGEDEEDLKKEEEAAATGLAGADAEGQPLKPKADDLLPAAPEEGGEGGEMPPGAEGGEMPPGMGSEEQGPPGGEMPPGGGEEPGAAPPEEAGSEADRRLPPPPRE